MLGLDAKQMRLVTRTYEGFVRRGAKLDAAQKAQLSRLQPAARYGLSPNSTPICWPMNRPTPARPRRRWRAFPRT